MVSILVITGFLSLPFDAIESMIQTRLPFFIVHMHRNQFWLYNNLENKELC